MTFSNAAKFLHHTLGEADNPLGPKIAVTAMLRLFTYVHEIMKHVAERLNCYGPR